MRRDVPSFYKEYLRKNFQRLQDDDRSLEIAFQKKMKNLIYGTNRSIFFTTSGKENEGTEKWSSGKPINRLNVRATILNFFPDNIVDSIYINTYRDERELVIWALVDATSALFPAGFDTGVEDPFRVKAVYALHQLSILRYLASQYNAKLRILFYPGLAPAPLEVDIKRKDIEPFAPILDFPARAAAPPVEPFTWLIRKRVRHAVIVVISDENAFVHDAILPHLQPIHAFSMTNDILYFPICTDYDAILDNAPGALEVKVGSETRLVATEREKKEVKKEIRDRLIAYFAALARAGIQCCPIQCGKEDWVFDVFEFFKRRLVTR